MRGRHALRTFIPLLWLAFALRVWGLGTQSLWYDEGYSAYLGSHLSLSQALDLTVRDIVPPFYYLLLRLWLPFTGTSEYALRFLSVLFGVVAVALIARIGHRLVRSPISRKTETAMPWGGLLSGALAAIAPVLIWLSRDARMYGPLVTWSLLATWGMLKATSVTATPNSRRRAWALFVGAGLAALYSHTISAFWLIGQVAYGLFIIWRQRHQRKRVFETLSALGLMAVGYLPWVIVTLISYQTNAGYWPGYLPPPHLWRTAWETFVGGQHLSTTQTALAAAWFGAAGLLGWLILLLRRPRVAMYLFCYLVIPLFAMGVAFQRTPKLAPRYPTAMAPALFLILTVGAVNALLASRLVRYASLVTLLGAFSISLCADVNLYSKPEYANTDWRAAANHIQANREPDEAVLLISGHTFPVFAYYYGWEGWDALPDDVQLDINHVLDYPSVAPRLDRVLAGADGAWLVLWQDEVVDPTGLLPALLSDVGHELPTPVFQGSSAGDQVQLRHFKFGASVQFPDALPIQHPLDQTAAPGLKILGYSLSATSNAAGTVDPLPSDAGISTRIFWLAEEPLKGAHAATLRIYDRMDQEWARQDTLLAGPYFSERWPTSTPVMGQFTATLPLGTPPGIYESTLMLYRGDETFETLHLAPLAITRPLSIPSPSALGLPLLSPPQAAEIGQFSLVGVSFDQETITPCQDWSLSLAWQVKARPPEDYRLRLSAGSDQVETPLAADFPTTQWQAGDVWRTRHHLPVNCRALDGVLPVVAQLLDADGRPTGTRLDLGKITIAAGRQFTLPSDLTAVLSVRLADVGVLEGYRLDKEQFQPGENLQVTLYWRAGQETDRNYSVFVHLESDQVWAQHDGWPVNGQKPTSTWAQGEIVADQHAVEIGQDVPPGSYRLVVGMYDLETLQPLAAVWSNGKPIESGRIVLQSIAISVP